MVPEQSRSILDKPNEPNQTKPSKPVCNWPHQLQSPCRVTWKGGLALTLTLGAGADAGAGAGGESKEGQRLGARRGFRRQTFRDRTKGKVGLGRFWWRLSIRDQKKNKAKGKARRFDGAARCVAFSFQSSESWMTLTFCFACLSVSTRVAGPNQREAARHELRALPTTRYCMYSGIHATGDGLQVPWIVREFKMPTVGLCLRYGQCLVRIENFTSMYEASSPKTDHSCTLCVFPPQHSVI